ncbi:hypothetical protein [uncultured Clostridium sp.]|uniref:hypothetical protein n=1 Tax=uncultured Clostridium sp. TaxID=59620 RepID=UPI0026086890|nr:hypothetical protein [uncultured Clostridium sp.]
MKIEEIWIKTDEGRVRLEECMLIKGFGIEGDRKGGTPLKEVVLYINDKSNLEIEGLCHKKFKANIVIRKDNNESFKVNDVIRFGEGKIQINKIGKRCYEECKIVRENKKCYLKDSVLFGSVIESGKCKIDK